MLERFFGAPATRSDPAIRHYQIAAGAGALSPRPRAIFCQAAGTITLEGEVDGAGLPYTMTAGQVLPFAAVKATAIASGTFYALC